MIVFGAMMVMAISAAAMPYDDAREEADGVLQFRRRAQP